MKIIVRMPFIYENMEIRARLEKTATDLGHSMTFLSDADITAADVSDCQIYFGKVPVALLKDMKNLLWYQSPSAGVDGYTADGVFANADVQFTNGSGAYGVTIAEYQLMMLLMFMRSQPKYIEAQKEMQWKNLGNVRSIFGSTFVVIGTGNLGGEFAKRVKALGGYVIGVRRTGSALEEGFDEMFNVADLDKVLPRGDVISLNLPGTSETTGILTKDRIDILKSNAIIVNVGRGSAIDQEALAQALNSEKIAGALLDVTVPEPLPKEHPLWTAKNSHITPHVSGNYSLEYTCKTLVDIFEENLKKFTNGQALNNIVDRKAGY